MNRLALCVALLATGPLAAQATPLTFGAINGRDDLSNRTDLASCATELSPDGTRACTLTRTSFGGLPVSVGTMTLNAHGSVRSVAILLDADNYDTARQLLAGRYGAPDVAGVRPNWRGFEGNATISIDRVGRNTIVRFEFPENRLAPPAARLNLDLAWELLLFVGVGAAAGILLRRAQRAPSAPASAQPSMRATLERRLREGRDLSL